MKNKNLWLETDKQDPILNFSNILKKDFVSPEIHVFPACVTKQLENLQKRWEEGKKK